MKVLITGKNGQLGRDLCRLVPVGAELFAYGHAELDIASEPDLKRIVSAVKPDIIINAAAYTAVDKAESDQDNAFAINASGAGYLAAAAQENAALLIHVSTDFVFDGTKSTPYQPDDLVAPLSVYGKSKEQGEALIRKHHADNSIVIRTSWVYSTTGNNFVKTMIRLMGERSELRVGADQIGSPTWSRNLARAIWHLVDADVQAGTLHWADAGVASWYDFAVAIYEEASSIGLLDKPVIIHPITTSQYPTPARRPHYSVLDTTSLRALPGIQSEHWRAALKQMLLELKDQR